MAHHNARKTTADSLLLSQSNQHHSGCYANWRWKRSQYKSTASFTSCFINTDSLNTEEKSSNKRYCKLCTVSEQITSLCLQRMHQPQCSSSPAACLLRKLTLALGEPDQLPSHLQQQGLSQFGAQADLLPHQVDCSCLCEG